MTTNFRRSRLAVLAATAVAMTTVFGGGDAFAEDDTITISGCVDQHGNLRVVDDPTTCKKNETPLTWNLQGPQGDTGPQGEPGPIGPVGPQGEKGEKGDMGPAGAQGLKGDTGPMGPRGFQGERGFTGPQGMQGPMGPQGPQGLKGDKGDAGAVGPRGLQGERGFTGERGLQGFQGPQGIPGATGATGPMGPTGPRGPSGVIATDYIADSAPAPTNTRAFLAPTATLTVTANQRIHVSSQRVLGSKATGGARDLILDICYQSTAAGAPVVEQGDYLGNIAVPQGMAMPFSLDEIIEGLPAGTYKVGLCGYVFGSGVAANWNFNEWGRTSAFVTQIS